MAGRETSGVRCPFCKQLPSHVVDSRIHPRGRRRRYRCESCHKRFTTIEVEWGSLLQIPHIC